MATIQKSFQFMSGRVGHLVFKTRLNKQYVSTTPDHYRKSESEAAVKGRCNFAFFSRLSHAISHNFVLNAFWRDIRIPGLTTQNVIQKVVSKQVTDLDFSGITLAPCESPFKVSLKEIHWQENNINLSILPLGSEDKITTSMYPAISAQGFLFLYYPEKENKNKFTFLPLNSIDRIYNTNDELFFSFFFNREELDQVSTSSEQKLVINLAVKNDDGKPVRCSNTIYIEHPEQSPANSTSTLTANTSTEDHFPVEKENADSAVDNDDEVDFVRSII